MPNIGSHLRELRINRDLTLKQVADDTGFAVSFLSLLERDKVSISVDNLERLAHYYGVRMLHFFQGSEDEIPHVVRHQEITRRFEGVQPGSAAFLMLTDRRDAQMEPLIAAIGAGHGDPHFRTHEGDALLLVLEGAVRLLTEKGDAITLSTGDAAYYAGFPGHRVENANVSLPALILIVTAPPTSVRDDVADAERGVLLQSEE